MCFRPAATLPIQAAAYAGESPKLFRLLFSVTTIRHARINQMQLVAPPQHSQERSSDSGIVSPETLKYFAASLRVSEESISEFVKAGMPIESIVDAAKWLKCNPNHHCVPLSGSSYVGERNSMDRPNGWGR
jgi:hypothetical protein